jgi:outer membrane receptor protein involved in Fe transport
MPITPMFKQTPLAAAIAAAICPIQLAQAQDEELSDVLEEVIVTATLREVNMQDLSQSIQAFTNEDIIRHNMVSFSDLANATPSLTVVADQPGRNKVKFRGISTGTEEFYTDSLVSVYLDETPLTFNSQQLWPAMVDIERIESLPGPQSTYFGSASQAGTVRIIGNKPNHEGVSGEVFGRYYATDGGDGSYELSGHVNIPLIENTLAMRLVAYSRDEGGWIDNIFGETYVPVPDHFQAASDNAAVVEDDHNTYKLTGGRISALWDVNEDWRVLFTYLNEQGELDGAWGEDTYLGEHKITRFFDEYRNDDWWNISMTVTGDLGFANLTWSTSYLERDINYEWDRMMYGQWKDSYYGQCAGFDPADYNTDVCYWGGYDLYFSDYTYGTTPNIQSQDRFAQEIRLVSSGDSRFQWMIGAFYEDMNDNWIYGARNPDLADTTMFYYANYWAYWYNYYGYDVQYPLAPTTWEYSDVLDRTVKQTAIFGEVSYRFTDHWTATVGGRWFEFERREYNKQSFPHGFPPWDSTRPGIGWFGEVGSWDWDTLGVLDSTSKLDDTIFKFSTQYSIDDDKMVYFLYSEGFRQGGENSPRAASRGFIPLSYNPDYLDNYELGIKSDWLDNRLRLNATYFHMEWQDYQLSEGDPDGDWWVYGTVNGGTVEQEGFELDMSWQATDALRVETRLFFGDPKHTSRYEFLNGDVAEPGDPLPNSSDERYYFALDYTFQQPVFGGQLWARFDYAHSGETWNSIGAATNGNPWGLIPAWDVSNLQVGLSLADGWDINFFVNNLNDHRVVTGRSDGRWASDWTLFKDPRWRNVEYLQRPRHYGFSVRKRFD